MLKLRSMTKPLQNYILSHRRKHALSQSDLAVLVGAENRATVSRYEHALRLPNLESALALEVVFGTPSSELFVGLSESVRQDVSRRARALLEVVSDESGPEFAKKVELLSKLARPEDEVIVPLWEDEP